MGRKAATPAATPTATPQLKGSQLIREIVKAIGPEANAAKVREVLNRDHSDRTDFPAGKAGDNKINNYTSKARGELGFGGSRTRASKAGSATPSLFGDGFDPVQLIKQVQALSNIGLTAEQVEAVAALVEKFGAGKVVEMTNLLGGKK